MLNDYHIDVPRYREGRKAERQVAAPIFLLWGARGNLAGKPVLDVWREVADDVDGVEIAGGGHYIPEKKPDEVPQDVVHFAERCFEGA